MWEFCVTASKNNKNAILYIQENMKELVKECGGVLCFDEKEDECLVCLGAEKKKSSLLKQTLAKVLCGAICEKMKYNYLKENVLVNVHDENLFEAFIKVYTYFDIELERAIAIRAIYFPKTLNLNSFLEFRLRSLKQKWNEMIKLTNLNASVFVQSETFLDLLKFLISNLDSKLESILIDFASNKVLSKTGKNFEVVGEIRGESVLEVLTKTIELSPKKIVLKNAQNKEMLKVLRELLQNRLEIIKN